MFRGFRASGCLGILGVSALEGWGDVHKKRILASASAKIKSLEISCDYNRILVRGGRNSKSLLSARFRA